ncbi:MAG TPA: hypothetical protein VKB02_00985 [Pyrinomonadaceae bacterium]|nr:hypothetical protein [Pyrinomonadaceae bacterium]
MYTTSFSVMFSAVRLLFKSRRVLLMLLLAWGGLLTALYLFASTREATIFQLLLTLVVVIAAPALFFVLQVMSVTYASGSVSGGRIRKTASDCLKLILVSLPVLVIMLLAIYGLNKVQTYLTLATTLRYLLIGVVAPMLAIQLWIATTSGGLRDLRKGLRGVLSKTFAPQSVFVYACGFLIFAVVPYVLLQAGTSTERPWLELSVLVVRLAASAILILLGWVTTVGAISILNRTERGSAGSDCC